jgi:hypothetical protein
MKNHRPSAEVFLVTTLLLALPAHAALQARYLGGSAIPNAYYDTTLNITWLANADLAATNTFGVSGSFIKDLMGWQTAQNWIAAMNKSDYLGYSDWRLPKTDPVDGSGFAYYYSENGQSDVGFNISSPGTLYAGSKGSEMANLFYYTLGNQGYLTTSGAINPKYGLKNTGPFNNLRADTYWSGTVYAPSTTEAWMFSMLYGGQDFYYKDDVAHYYAMVVRTGDVTAVPEPECHVLMMTGLGLLGIRALRRR